MPKIVALIPARGGSKGIPGKNLVEVSGKPLIYYTIKAALESKVDETWVSSEDDEILKVAHQCGAKTLRRPMELATDTATSEEVLLHFADNVYFDILVFLQATSPMCIAEDIDRAIEMMKEYDSVLTMTELTQFVWFGGKPSYDLSRRKRRQDCEKTYLETGALFVTTRENLMKSKNRLSGKIGFCIVPKYRSFDVDTYEDLEIIRRLMK